MIDKAQLLADQEAILKKYALLIASDEINVMLPEIAQLVISFLPAEAQAVVGSIDALAMPQMQQAISALIQSKLAPPAAPAAAPAAV